MKALISILALQLAILSSLQSQDLTLINLLPNTINESSGLINIDGTLITHLDSDGANALFELDSTDASIIRTVYIQNADNIDWEDITHDDNYIYIGDFGNNSGARTNLKVYRIALNDYLTSSNDTVLADTIAFSYANQIDFTSGSNNTNFDAEAMISLGDSIYIFSKNWISNTCDVYSLSNTPGTYSIQKVDSFDSQGLITAATYISQTNELYLTGYGPPIPFVIQASNFTGFPFNQSQLTHTVVQVPSGSSVQIEAITSRNSSSLYISSEVSVLGEASLMTLDKMNLVGIREIETRSLHFYPNPSNGIIQIDKQNEEIIELFNLNGQLITRGRASTVNTNELGSGKYILLLKGENGKLLARNFLIVKE